MDQLAVDIELNPLHRADGSAKYSYNGVSIVGGVNGPVEIQRRDEIPEEAAIDVVIRPATGVGGVRERYLESIVESILRHIVLVAAHPRKLIQVTLQIVTMAEDDSMISILPQAASNIRILPALLQTSVYALLSASIPLLMTLTSTLIAVDLSGKLLSDPSVGQLRKAISVHAVAFSSHGNLLMVESEGEFNYNTWEAICAQAERICRGSDIHQGDGEDVSMDARGDMSLEDVLRTKMQEKLVTDHKWKEPMA